MKSQVNIRASALLQRQLDELTAHLGTSITETVSIAIDRMYQQEIKTMNAHILYKNGTTETIPGVTKQTHVPLDGSKGIYDYNPQRFKPTNLVLSLEDGTERIIPSSEIAHLQFLSNEELAAGYKFLLPKTSA